MSSNSIWWYWKPLKKLRPVRTPRNDAATNHKYLKIEDGIGQPRRSGAKSCCINDIEYSQRTYLKQEPLVGDNMITELTSQFRPITLQAKEEENLTCIEKLLRVCASRSSTEYYLKRRYTESIKFSKDLKELQLQPVDDYLLLQLMTCSSPLLLISSELCLSLNAGYPTAKLISKEVDPCESIFASRYPSWKDSLLVIIGAFEMAWKC